jgi:hypothetical protein
MTAEDKEIEDLGLQQKKAVEEVEPLKRRDRQIGRAALVLSGFFYYRAASRFMG